MVHNVDGFVIWQRLKCWCQPLCLMVGVLHATTTFAGDIEGVVVEGWSKVTGMPKAIAGVRVEAKSAGITPAVTLTDMDGRYKFVGLASAQFDVHFSRVGYIDDPTVKSGIMVGAGVSMVDAELDRQGHNAAYFAQIAGTLVERSAMTAEGNPDKVIVEYKRFWNSLYLVNTPVTQKVQFANAMVARDDRFVTAVPQVNQYREANAEALALASKEIAEAMKTNNFESAQNSEAVKSLPTAVFADVLTRAVVVSPNTAGKEDSIARVQKFSKAFDKEREASASALINLRLEPLNRRRLDSLTNPK